jgi:DNA-binding MarR family transcriptional regulator
MDKRDASLLIWQINNELEKEFNAEIRSIGLTSSQFHVLSYLFDTEKDEVNQIDVEKYLRLKNPTVTGLLKRLEEKGFILIVSNAKDRRRKNIFLTEKAHTVRKKMEAAHRRIENRVFKKLTKKERESLQRLLGKVVDHLDD